MKAKRPPLKEGVSPRIALFDIETSPQEGKNWGGTYEVDILEITRYSHMLAWSVKELDGKTVTRALCDYSLYRGDKRNDKALVEDLHDELMKYDIIVGHNGDKFDIKYTNARFVFHNLSPLPPFRTVDTCKAARQYFLFPSNKLNELLKFFGLKQKVETGGYGLWTKCIEGDRKAWKLMKKYNAYDVLGLEAAYKRMRPYIKNHPNLTHFTGDIQCPACLSRNVIKRMTRIFKNQMADQMSCNNCNRWFNVNQRGRVS